MFIKHISASLINCFFKQMINICSNFKCCLNNGEIRYYLFIILKDQIETGIWTDTKICRGKCSRRSQRAAARSQWTIWYIPKMKLMYKAIHIKKIRVTSNLNGVNKMIIMSNLTPHNDIWTKTIYWFKWVIYRDAGEIVD